MALSKKIGVVSPIKSGHFKAVFEDGVKSIVSGVTFKYQDDLGYDQKKLEDAVTSFCSAPNLVGLIVTFGGMMANAAADNKSSVPFLSLVGATPTDRSSCSYGGVSLQTTAQDADRVQYLVNQKGATKISLYYNKNSSLSGAELVVWGALSAQYPKVVNPTPIAAFTGPNDSAQYASSVMNIPDGAVVISADPYFQDTKDDLIAALNSWVNPDDAANNYVCYPLYEYRNLGGTRPISGHATLLGPRILDCVGDLGNLAGDAICNAANVGFLKEPPGPAVDL
jgi:hypothetical protein